VGEQVSVASFEALSNLRSALSKFVDETSGVLYAADAHLQRMKTWVKTEQANHWQAEGRKRAELLLRAKLTLKAKKLTPTPLGGRPSCVEEEEAVKLAMRRMEEAEEKAKAVRFWTRKIDEEGLAYSGSSSSMKQALSTDLPAAIARLDHMLAALEAYASNAAPQMQGSVAATSWAPGADGSTQFESVSRGTPPQVDNHEESRQQSIPPPPDEQKPDEPTPT